MKIRTATRQDSSLQPSVIRLSELVSAGREREGGRTKARDSKLQDEPAPASSAHSTITE